MTTQKQRSVFWVVSTHVLTTGFVMPLLARILATVMIIWLRLPPLMSFAILLASLVLGYIGGAFYSLSYIRKVAIIEDPNACVKPSIIAFTVLALLGLVVSLSVQLKFAVDSITSTVTAVILVAVYAVICIAFARITRRGFDSGSEKSSGQE